MPTRISQASVYMNFFFSARQVLVYADQPALYEEPGTTLVVHSSDPDRSLGTDRRAEANRSV